ncbi:hypothetical protein [Chryseobacterium gwangjuense]|uniref:hypothetical protein n=1 Tax=Chryseobacterium gwangjuense TaxID=1069980 RepID=UPI001E3FA42E|nr:hypothetical protein [Chryseobacterium gwangjuense]MCE3076101.1 hypothetical protein [Chryseobacterium gwangjuense]
MIAILNIKNKALQSAILTIAFYIAYYLLSLLGEYFDKTGPCTPGLGILLLMFLPIVTLALLIVNLIKYYYYHEKHLKYSILIHGLVLLSLLCFYIYISKAKI